MIALEERIDELTAAIEANERHLADCEAERPTDYLRSIMRSWAGTDEIDFRFVASVIRYSVEEDRDNLWKLRRLLRPIVDRFDPMGLGWTNFEEDDLNWPALIGELTRIVRSEEFRGNPDATYGALHALYSRHVDSLNTMGCGWFAGFVAGAIVANEHAAELLTA